MESVIDYRPVGFYDELGFWSPAYDVHALKERERVRQELAKWKPRRPSRRNVRETP